MPQRIDTHIDGLPSGGIRDWNFDGVILTASQGDVGLNRLARSEVEGTGRRQIRGARIKRGRKTKELSARSKRKWIPVELLESDQFVGSRCKFGKTKLAIGPGCKCASRLPMFVPLAVQLQMDSQIPYRVRKVHIPDDQ